MLFILREGVIAVADAGGALTEKQLEGIDRIVQEQSVFMKQREKIGVLLLDLVASGFEEEMEPGDFFPIANAFTIAEALESHIGRILKDGELAGSVEPEFYESPFDPARVIEAAAAMFVIFAKGQPTCQQPTRYQITAFANIVAEEANNFFRQPGRWITAEQAERGMEEAVEKLRRWQARQKAIQGEQDCTQDSGTPPLQPA